MFFAVLGAKVWLSQPHVTCFVAVSFAVTVAIFCVLWRRGRLDMGEGPKFQMLGLEGDGGKDE